MIAKIKTEKIKQLELRQKAGGKAAIDKLEKAKDEAQRALVEGKGKQAPLEVKMKNEKIHKLDMSEALERMAQQGSRANPIFKRGAEVEISTMQDMEMLKAHLASQKIHIPNHVLERGIVIPRDMDEGKTVYPYIGDLISENPIKAAPIAKKKKKKKKKAAPGSHLAELADLATPVIEKLRHNERMEYKPYEWGNKPYRADGKPKGGVWRLMLPPDVDWTHAPHKEEAD